jgi:predicted aldo/keto reductase-like oxidoreductase
MTRREFVAVATGAGLAPVSGRAAQEEIPRRKLGKTGERVSIIGLGGFHVGTQADERESIRIIRGGIEGGITFLDNCWDYNDGESELRMGKALADGYREKVFLMSKIDGRDKATAARQIDESLQRLRTDRLDLMQLHEVIHARDPEIAFREDGAIAALVEARKAGKIRFIGFTGHKSADLHLAMLRAADAHRFAFDTVQLPLNLLDVHTDGFQKRVLPVLAEKRIGVLGMKPLADKLLLQAGAASAPDALRYAMSLHGVSVTITGCDRMEILEQALRVARGFTPLREDRMGELVARSAPAARGDWERYKHTHDFDGTVQHPEWLGHPA